MLEQRRFELEKDRLENEKNNSRQLEQNRKDDLKIKYISLAISIAIPLFGYIFEGIKLRRYYKLAIMNMRMTYVDNMIPNPGFKDAQKSIMNLIK